MDLILLYRRTGTLFLSKRSCKRRYTDHYPRIISFCILVTMFQGAGKIMYYYNNNVVKALINLFPNIGLERDKFCYMPRMNPSTSLNPLIFFISFYIFCFVVSYWQSKSNRRAYLAVFAAEHALDPHDAGAKGWGEVGEMSCTLCICKSLKNLM